MDLSRVKNIYFIGIGGIGMSALARYFHAQGIFVSGYDKTPSDVTDKLINTGIDIHFEDNPDLIPKQTELAIYTPAIPANHKGLSYVRQHNIPLLKRSEVLGLITKDKYTIAIAGTHGKTTISSIVAHIFKTAKLNISAFVGGIANNYQSNFIGNPDGDIIIVEADEFDRSFLTLHPDIALVSSVDADHLDIYKDKNRLWQSFQLFTKNIKKQGKLIVKKGISLGADKENTYTYSLQEAADYYCKNIEITKNSYLLDIMAGHDLLPQIPFSYPGRHNIENAGAAVAVAKLYGVDEQSIKTALASYTGVKRRFELIVDKPHCIYIDDYAHHPEEIRACVQSVKELYPNKKITAVFQPHLFSRTRDLAEDFATSLALLDELIMLEIYPAREEPITGIDAQYLLEKVPMQNKSCKSKQGLLDYIKQSKPELLLSLGAGDIDKLVEPIKKILSNE